MRDVPDWTIGDHVKALEGDSGGVRITDWPPGMMA
jgi:hypothetical protein